MADRVIKEYRGAGWKIDRIECGTRLSFDLKHYTSDVFFRMSESEVAKTIDMLQRAIAGK